MMPDKCPSLFKCHKIHGIFKRDESMEQTIDRINAVCTICLGPKSFDALRTPLICHFPRPSQIWQ